MISPIRRADIPSTWEREGNHIQQSKKAPTEAATSVGAKVNMVSCLFASIITEMEMIASAKG